MTSIERKRHDRMERIMDMADACRMATGAIHTKEGRSNYTRWMDHMKKELNRDIFADPETVKQKKTLWDTMGGKSKRLM